MKKTKNGQQVADNESGSQNQDGQSGNEKQGEYLHPSPKPLTTVEEDEQKAGTKKEHQDKEHQHDYKTPIGDQNQSSDSVAAKKN